MPISWTTHKGKKILVVDSRDSTPEQMMITIEEQKKIIDEASEPVLLLNDFRGTVASSEYMDKAKQYGKEQSLKIKKTALIGIQGIKKFLTQVYIRSTGNDNTRVFDDIEEAKDFLVSD